MDEFVTDALVLDKEDSGEYDSRVFLYTKIFGGLSARVTSCRKVTSKQAGHLEPLNFVTIRLIKKGESGNSFQATDVLIDDHCDAWRRTPETLHAGLRLVAALKDHGFHGDADPALWGALREIFTNPPTAPFQAYANRLLSVLGYDAQYAVCGRCAQARPAKFSFTDLAFFCAACAPRGTWGMVEREVWEVA